MVKDQDTPYLSIVGHVLAAASDNQREYIRAMALVIMLCIGRESEVLCFVSDSRIGRMVEESEARCMIVHYFRDQELGLFWNSWGIRKCVGLRLQDDLR